MAMHRWAAAWVGLLVLAPMLGTPQASAIAFPVLPVLMVVMLAAVALSRRATATPISVTARRVTSGWDGRDGSVGARQLDPDAAGRVRPRAPGRAGHRPDLSPL
jgi:Family of unknown function (DUF6412)